VRHPVKDPALECLIALSAALDLANGLCEDKSLLTAVFAAELAGAMGHDETVRAASFHAGLLRHMGCTAFAASESRIAQDDILLRRRLLLDEGGGATAVLAALVDANPQWLARVSGVLGALRGANGIRDDWTRQACEAAGLLAVGLQLGEPVVRALGEVFECWNGEGAPIGLAAEGISLPARVAQVAHTAVLLGLSDSNQTARARLASESGKRLDPQACRFAFGLLPLLEEPRFAQERLQRIGQAPAFALAVPLRSLATVFGEFTDLQSPFTHGHSRAVETLCREVASLLGADAATQDDLSLAASLHDLGQVCIPTSLWLLPRAWRQAERERARAHAYHTERFLAAAGPLARAARIAGDHHGPRHGVGAGDAGVLPMASRILAAAEIACGLREDRPHRPAHDTAAAAARLRALAAERVLDAQVVEATVSVMGLRARVAGARASRLTEREGDVMRHLALGRSNKEIARLLGISDRTVQTHTLNIYAKLGVKTRAGATLVAARVGLAGGADDHPPDGGFGH